MDPYQADLTDSERVASGRKIRELRQKKGYPPWLVASLCDINEETLRRYEAGERWPGFDTAAMLAAILEVSTDDLLPDDFFKRHTPPKRLLEPLGELLRFPVGTLAETGRGRRSSRRSKRAASVASSDDSNARSAPARAAKASGQRKTKPGGKRREGGFPTSPLRRAAIHTSRPALCAVRWDGRQNAGALGR